MTDPDDPAFGSPDEFYRDYYRAICGDDQGSVTRWAHQAMERRFSEDMLFGSVLEVGAGEGTHLPFVRHRFSRYVVSDTGERSIERARERFASRLGVEFLTADAEDLPFADDEFDRFVATCVLIHLPNPERALLEWRRVVRGHGGRLTIYVPNEGGVPLAMGRRLTTARAARKAGFAGYDLMVAREHRNNVTSLHELLHYVFRCDQVRVEGWPLRRSPLALRVFTVYDIVCA